MLVRGFLVFRECKSFGFWVFADASYAIFGSSADANRAVFGSSAGVSHGWDSRPQKSRGEVVIHLISDLIVDETAALVGMHWLASPVIQALKFRTTWVSNWSLRF